jgi:succinylglutamate desuccinylase
MRRIGQRQGEPNGKLLLLLGQIHGNEPAGTKAIKRFFERLDFEATRNHLFKWQGSVIGLLGNVEAAMQQKRFIEEDLNRLFTPELTSETKITTTYQIHEHYELRALINEIKTILDSQKIRELYVLDLHTTSGGGGIFVLPGFSEVSKQIAAQIPAPTILKIADTLHGTTLHYFNSENFKIPVHSVVFEAGQHDDQLAIDNALAAIICTMRSIGMIHPNDVETKHELRLKAIAQKLPPIGEVFFKYQIPPNTHFEMRPGFKSFDKITEGQHLADLDHQPILAPADGFLLMPKYQPFGQDGFFLFNENTTNV